MGSLPPHYNQYISPFLVFFLLNVVQALCYISEHWDLRLLSKSKVNTWWRQGNSPRISYDIWYLACYTKMYITVSHRCPHRLLKKRVLSFMLESSISVIFTIHWSYHRFLSGSLKDIFCHQERHSYSLHSMGPDRMRFYGSYNKDC